MCNTSLSSLITYRLAIPGGDNSRSRRIAFAAHSVEHLSGRSSLPSSLSSSDGGPGVRRQRCSRTLIHLEPQVGLHYRRDLVVGLMNPQRNSVVFSSEQRRAPTVSQETASN